MPLPDDATTVHRRTLAAVIAYLHLLERGWDRLSNDERRKGVQLALEAARRAAPPAPTGEDGAEPA